MYIYIGLDPVVSPPFFCSLPTFVTRHSIVVDSCIVVHHVRCRVHRRVHHRVRHRSSMCASSCASCSLILCIIMWSGDFGSSCRWFLLQHLSSTRVRLSNHTPGSQGPRGPGPLAPMLTLRRHLYTFTFIHYLYPKTIRFAEPLIGPPKGAVA